MAGATGRRKRPAWIWMISVFYIGWTGYTLLALYLVYAGMVPLNPAQQAYFATLSKVDRTMALVIGSGNILGAVKLLLLRKEAFYLFSGAFCACLLLKGWHVANEGLTAVMQNGSAGLLLGWAFALAVILYSRTLIKRGVLT